MFGLSKLFSKKKAALEVKLHKVENKDLMEAIVAGAVLVAHADGDCSDEELTVLHNIVEANDNLKHFGSEIGKTIDQYCDMYKAGARLAKVKLLKEIKDVSADEEQKIEAFIIAIEIADADGTIDETELAMLKTIGKELGLNPDNYI